MNNEKRPTIESAAHLVTVIAGMVREDAVFKSAESFNEATDYAQSWLDAHLDEENVAFDQKATSGDTDRLHESHQHEIDVLTASYEASKAKKEIVHKAEILDILDEIVRLIDASIAGTERTTEFAEAYVLFTLELSSMLDEIRQRIKGE